MLLGTLLLCLGAGLSECSAPRSGEWGAASRFAPAFPHRRDKPVGGGGEVWRDCIGDTERTVLGDRADVRCVVLGVARRVLEQQQSGQPALFLSQRQRRIESEQQQRVSVGVVALSARVPLRYEHPERERHGAVPGVMS